MSNRKSQKPKFDPAQCITDELIAILERGTLPWRRPWRVAGAAQPLRHSGEAYQGINNFLLTMRTQICGYGSPYWMTLRQANELGAKVRKGETSSVVVYYGQSYKDAASADAGQEEDAQDARKSIPFLKSYRVFNADQIEGLPEKFHPVAEIEDTAPGVKGTPKPIPHMQSFFDQLGAALAQEHPIPEGVYVGTLQGKTCGQLTVDYSEGHRFQVGECTSNRKGLADVETETDDITVNPIRNGAQMSIATVEFEVIAVERSKLIGNWVEEGNSAVKVFNTVSLKAKPEPVRPEVVVAEPEEPIGPFFTDKDSVRVVQAALTSFGYAPGPADGAAGRRTKVAIREFRHDAALPDGDLISERLLRALGLRASESPYKGGIYVSIENPNALGARLAALEPEEILAELTLLKQRSANHIDLNFSKPKPIVFVVYYPLKERALITTHASNIINGKKNDWNAAYNYPTVDDVPTEPLVIINEFETSNRMFLVHKLMVDGEVVTEKLTRAHRNGG